MTTVFWKYAIVLFLGSAELAMIRSAVWMVSEIYRDRNKASPVTSFVLPLIGITIYIGGPILGLGYILYHDIDRDFGPF